MKVTKTQLKQMIAEELEGLDPMKPAGRPGEQAPPPGNPCYIVYAGYKDYEQYVRFASSEKADVINFMRWDKETGRGSGYSDRLGVVEIAGDQIARDGGYEKDITEEVLASL